MISPEQQPAANRLAQALHGLHGALEEWLEDAVRATHDDPAFIVTFRRWEEQLTVIKLYLHRSEARLLHFIASVPTDAVTEDHPLPKAAAIGELAHHWRVRLEQTFLHHHVDSTYRRLESIRDQDQEAINADIITDLTDLCVLAQRTVDAIAAAPAPDDPSFEDVAFYRIISPWRTAGHAALLDVLRWLSETLREEEDW